MESVLDYIERCSAAADLSPAAWMVNRVVEYDDYNSINDGEWPPDSR